MSVRRSAVPFLCRRARLPSPVHPADASFPIGELAVSAGLIGLAHAPGTRPGGQGVGCLASDLDRIAEWGATIVVTLTEAAELHLLGIAAIAREVGRRHMGWQLWPIRDYQVPDAAFDTAWPGRSADLRAALAQGGRVLIHCRGGLGRTGMISARLLVDGGIAGAAAIAAVRAIRPAAIETAAQEQWVVKAVK